ncbi:MAG TPA: ABC transporter ATP-binding protein [Actinocrinis sp.]|nr:ABC transporter ATP-binding protein [Actinocrinis sp.]
MRKLPVPDPGVADSRSANRYLWWLIRHQRNSIALGMLWGVTWMVSQALMPAAVGHTIDAGITAKNSTALVHWSLIVLGLGALTAVSGILRHRNAVTNWLSGSYRTVQVVARKTTELGATLAKLASTGDVVAVGTSDIAEIGSGLDITARLTGAVTAIVVVAVIMLVTSVPLGLVVLIGVPMLTLLTALLLKPLHKRQAQYRVKQGELTGQAIDIAAGLRILRGIGGERVFARRYRTESQQLRVAAYSVTKIEALLASVEIILPGVIVTVVTWLAAHFALDGHLTVGNLVTFYGYAAFLSLPLATLMEAADLVTRAHVAAKRVVRILNLEPEIADAGLSAETAERVAHAGRAETLADPESGLIARTGQLLGVACTEPEQAQSLALRMARYEKPDGPGPAPTLDETDLAELPVADLRRTILLARNEDRFFSGSLRSELDCAGAADDADVLAALTTASAQDILDGLPDGLDTEVDEGGRSFSGGQLQRLRLARALLADRRFTLLIEPTSAVDAHTEARIAANLRLRQAAGSGPARATVVFSTSPLVLDQAHEVAFVADGKVVACGPHRDLLAHNPQYRALVTRGENA